MFIKHTQVLRVLSKRSLSVAFFLCCLCHWSAKAVPYASGITNTSGTISFVLNENADNVQVIFDSGTSTNDLGSLSKGVRSFSLGTSTNYQIVVTKKAAPGYVTPDSTGTNATSSLISTDANATLNYNSPRGLAINRDPNSAFFGRIYIANSAAGTFTNSTTSVARTNLGQGIYMLNADQSDALGQSTAARTGGITFTAGNAASPYRIGVGQDNRLYVCDWSDPSGNLYFADGNVSSGSGGFALKKLGATGQAVTPVGTNTHGSVSAVYVDGTTTGGNLKIYTIDEDLQVNKTATTITQGNSIWRYDVNAGTFPYNSDATLVAAITGKEGINFTSQTMDLDRGTNGYFYSTDNRSAGGESGLVIHSSTGTSLWNSYQASTNYLGSTTNTDILSHLAGVAVSPDQKYVALIRDDNRGWIIPLTNGIPDLSKRLWLVAFSGTSTTGTMRSIKFDAAGNLYIMSGGIQLCRVYSPGGTTVATTGNNAAGTAGTFSVARVDPDISTQPTSRNVAPGANTTFTVTGTGVGTLSYQWMKNGTNIAGATASALTLSNVQAADVASYSVVVTSAAGSVTSSSATLLLSQTITFTQGAVTYGVAPITLNGTASSGLPVTYTITAGGAFASLAGNVLTITGAGSVTVRAAQSGDGTYAAASNVSRTFTVNKAPLTVTAVSASKAYGEDVPTFSFNIIGFVNGEDASVLSGSPSVSTAATSSSPVSGSPYVITAAVGTLSASNYSFTFVNGQLTVNPVTLTVTAINASRAYGAANPLFSVTYSGFVNGDDASVISGIPGFSSSATSGSPVSGSPYTLVPSTGSLSATNYNFTFVSGSLTVTPTTLTVTADNQTRVYGATNPVLTVSYSGFGNGETLATSDVTGSPVVSTLADTNSTPLDGPYTITISQGTLASSNYSFVFSNGTLNVIPADVSILITPSANPVLSGSAVDFAASITVVSPGSGEPTGSLLFLTNGVAAVSVTNLTNGSLSATGLVLPHGSNTISVEYSGDSNFAAATNSLIEIVNAPPVAGTATYFRPADSTIKIRVSDLLTNATDPDGDTVTLLLVGNTSTNGGTISKSSNDVFYTPPASNGNVTDSFTYTVIDSFGGTNSGNVVLTVIDDNAPSVNITALTTLADGNRQIGFAGIPGRSYIIQATADLTPPITWTTLGTNSAGTNGLFQFIDLDATNHGTRYYRTAKP